jgi:hypothetical protein
MSKKYFVTGKIETDKTDFEFIILKREIQYKEIDYQLQLFEITRINDSSGIEIIKPKLIYKTDRSNIIDSILDLKKYNQENNITFETLKIETSSKRIDNDNEIDNFIRKNLI